MIQIGDTVIALDDPVVLLVLAGVAVVALVIVLLILSVRRTGQSAALMGPLAQSIDALGQRVQGLSDGQHQLSGGLTHVCELQALSQA